MRVCVCGIDGCVCVDVRLWDEGAYLGGGVYRNQPNQLTPLQHFLSIPRC